MKNLGKSIRALRIIHDLKQKEFAERIGVSISYLCEIEKGKNTPSIHVVQKISNSFGIPIHTLFILEQPIKNISEDAWKGLPEVIQLIIKIREHQKNIQKKRRG